VSWAAYLRTDPRSVSRSLSSWRRTQFVPFHLNSLADSRLTKSDPARKGMRPGQISQLTLVAKVSARMDKATSPAARQKSLIAAVRSSKRDRFIPANWASISANRSWLTVPPLVQPPRAALIARISFRWEAANWSLSTFPSLSRWSGSLSHILPSWYPSTRTPPRNSSHLTRFGPAVNRLKPMTKTRRSVSNTYQARGRIQIGPSIDMTHPPGTVIPSSKTSTASPGSNRLETTAIARSRCYSVELLSTSAPPPAHARPHAGRLRLRLCHLPAR